VAGATTTCTITNSRPGVDPGSEERGGWGRHICVQQQLRADISAYDRRTGSLTIANLAAGSSYSLSERVPPGWAQTSATCTNGTPAAITVAGGATTTCTITNTRLTVPDLTIRKIHAGNFRQGDTADTYTLTVANVGQGPTTGAVTVSDTLPAGLTATAIGGAGWSCVLATFTCTRSDVLAPGASYPVITVTASVAENPLVFSPVAGSPAFQTAIF